MAPTILPPSPPPPPQSPLFSRIPVFSLSILHTSCSYVNIFLRHYFSQASISLKISDLFICFCSFDLSCTILEKDNIIETLYIILPY